MRTILSRVPVLLIPICVVMLVGGCLARGGLAGSVSENFDAPVDAVHQAVLSTMRAERLDIQSESVDAATSLIKAQYADDTKLTVHTERLTEKASRVTVQVGSFGNEERSKALLKGVRERLPEASADE